MSDCSVLNCERPALARQLCSSHYARFKRGVPLDKPLGTKTPGGKPCSINNCDRRAVSYGLCTTHRARAQAGTDIDAPVATKFITNDLLERLRRYAPEGAPDECWEWTASTNKGYGAMAVHGSKMRVAHVVAWELHHGRPLPRGLVVRHTCDNPPCTNPAHLVLGTHADNVADRVEHGRPAYNGSGFRHRTSEEIEAMRQLYADGMNMSEISRQFGCSRAATGRIVKGESFASGVRRVSSVAKVTDEDVRAIRHLYAEGVSQVKISNMFGIHQTAISAIVRRQTWAHVP